MQVSGKDTVSESSYIHCAYCLFCVNDRDMCHLICLHHGISSVFQIVCDPSSVNGSANRCDLSSVNGSANRIKLK